MQLFPFHRKHLNLGRVRAKSQPSGRSRVSARLGLRQVWFGSRQAMLHASIEAFGSLALFAAAHHGQRLRISQPVDQHWHTQVQQLFPWWEKWWHYRPQPPQVASFSGSHRSRTESSTANRESAPRAAGLFFTAGVDSFFSLLHAEPKPAVLVYVHGYDIPLHECDFIIRLYISKAHKKCATMCN